MAACLLYGSQTPSHSVANWARKYGVECSACHSPAVPRLNKTGHQFRKMGFRMESEIGQQPEYKEIGEFLSFRQRTRYQVTNNPGGANRPLDNEFRFNDATLFYEGAITPVLTAMVELEVEGKDTISPQFYGSWTKGDLGNYWSARFGRLGSVRSGYGGFDRPTGISTPSILNMDLTGGAGNSALKLGGKSLGIEVNRGWDQDNRVYLEVRNGTDSLVGDDNVNGGLDKDFLLAYERLVDERGSAFTLFGYSGAAHLDVDGDGAITAADGTDTVSQVDTLRLGGTFSYITKTAGDQLPWEIQGGLVYAKDDAPAGDTKGDGFYLQVQKNLPKNAAAFLRYDKVDDDGGRAAGDTSEWITLGGVRTVSNNWRIAAELQHRDRDFDAEKQTQLTLESMLVW